MKKRPASSGGPRESITDFAIRANLTYEQARRELLVGHVRGGRDGGGRLYVESRSVDEFVEANTHSADTVTRETAARMIGGGVDANRVDRMMTNGQLTKQFVGGEWVVETNSVKAYIQKRDTVVSTQNKISVTPSRA